MADTEEAASKVQESLTSLYAKPQEAADVILRDFAPIRAEMFTDGRYNVERGIVWERAQGAILVRLEP